MEDEGVLPYWKYSCKARASPFLQEKGLFSHGETKVEIWGLLILD
jgi:hypothetical protein